MTSPTPSGSPALERLDEIVWHNERNAEHHTITVSLWELREWHKALFASPAVALSGEARSILEQYIELESKWDHGRFFELGCDVRRLLSAPSNIKKGKDE